MGVCWIALLGLAVGVLVAAEWPRIAERLPLGADAGASAAAPQDRPARRAARSQLDDSDDFAASVERDLAPLPTIKERDRNR